MPVMPGPDGQPPAAVTPVIIDGPLAGQHYAVPAGRRQFLVTAETTDADFARAEAAYRDAVNAQSREDEPTDAAAALVAETAREFRRVGQARRGLSAPLIYTIDKVVIFGRYVLVAHLSQRPPAGLLWDLLVSDAAKKAEWRP